MMRTSPIQKREITKPDRNIDHNVRTMRIENLYKAKVIVVSTTSELEKK